MKSHFKPLTNMRTHQFGLWSIQMDETVLTRNKKIVKDKITTSVTLKMSYLFQKSEIATFVFRKDLTQDKYWLNNFFCHDLDSDIINSISKIDSKAQYASLINYYLFCLKTNSYDENIFKKHVFNYLEGPITDSLDYKMGHGLIISDIGYDGKQLAKRILKEEIFPILKYEGIQHSFVSDRSLWLRDYVLPMGNGEQQICETNLLDTDGIEAAEQLAKSNQNHAYSREWPYGFELTLGGSCISSDEYYASRRKGIHTLCQNNDVPYKISKAILEGGNIITVTRQDKPHVIVGKNLRYVNAAYFHDKNTFNIKYQAQIEKKYPRKNDGVIRLQSKVSEYKIKNDALKHAKLAIEKELNLPKERITWLENVYYHADIYVAAGPHNVIFLHSNKLMAELGEKDFYLTGSLTSANIMIAANSLEKTAGDILEKNKRKLINHGYVVVEVPGVGHQIDRSSQDNEFPMIINLMNGYSGKGKNGFFYITLACCVKTIQDEFTRILHNNGVDNVYYVGTSEEAIEILDLEGSLRCMSVSGSAVFGHLGSRFGHNGMTSTTADINNIHYSDDSSIEEEDEAEVTSIIPENGPPKEGSDIEYSSSDELSVMDIIESKVCEMMEECNDKIYQDNNWSTMFSHSYSDEEEDGIDSNDFSFQLNQC